jgi:hypothetical protein
MDALSMNDFYRVFDWVSIRIYTTGKAEEAETYTCWLKNSY